MLRTVVLIAVALTAYTAAAPQGSSTQTECQRHRAREMAKNNPLLLIPTCTASGDYEAVQCHPPSVGGKQFCQCWTKTGDPASSPSTKTKACGCILKKKELTQTASPANAGVAVGGYTPQCEEDGTFKAKQCHASTNSCWCVDKSTGEKKTGANATC